MSPKSLRELASTLDTAESYIRFCLNSPKRDKVFCLVEGEIDEHIYAKHLNPKVIEVIVAVDDKYNHNCKTVEAIVCRLQSLCPQGRVIGIRDKDYHEFMGHQCPLGIYTTDRRDLEMMIFDSDSFRSFDPQITQQLREVLPFCIQLGYLRIYAECQGIRTSIKKNLKISAVYDQKAKRFFNNTVQILRKQYKNKIDCNVSDVDIDNFIRAHNLDKYSAYDICRGHDVIGLLEYVYGNNYERSTFEKRWRSIILKMIFISHHYLAGYKNTVRNLTWLYANKKVSKLLNSGRTLTQ